MKYKIISISLFLTLLYGCDYANEAAPSNWNVKGDGDYAVMTVHFGTDRAENTGAPEADRFGGGRGELVYGQTEVSIPRDHRMGALESPSIWRLEFREDPEKHIMVLDLLTQSREDFFGELRTRLDEANQNSALIFFHGYNVTFRDAARRTAQLTYDLGFKGAPVFYSWPSQGQVTGYTIDENNIEWSEPNIKAFLQDFANQSGAEHIYLIGHSMGNRGLTKAYARLMREQPHLRQRFREIILAAPDIDAEVFKRDIAPAMIAAGTPITLYASSYDKALAASKAVHGYPRAGESGPDLVVINPGIDTIDASNVTTDFLGHSYFGDASSILSDMFYLVRDSKRPSERAMLEPSSDQRYWLFRKTR